MRPKRSRHILQCGEFFSLLHDMESRIDLQPGIQQIAQFLGKTNDLRSRKAELGVYGCPFHDRPPFAVRPVFFLDRDRLQPVDVEFSEYLRSALSCQFSANPLPSSVYCLEDEYRHSLASFRWSLYER